MLLVVLRRSGPAWDPALPLEEQAGWAAHAAFLEGLVEDGAVVLGGPLADGERVVLAVEAPSAEVARALLAADPWSGTHLVVETVEPWTILLDGRTAGPETRPAAGAGVRGLVFVGSHTSARASMRRFVEDVLGLTPTPVDGVEADVYALADGTALAVADADDRPPERTIGLLVDDLEAAVARLEAAGVETDGVHENARWRYTHFRAPDGRLYELVEERGARPPGRG